MSWAVAQAGTITYTDHIRPIFQDNCFKCHNPDEEKGGLDLTTMNAVLAGGGSGEVVVPGDPGVSLLYLLITHQEEPTMPPKASKRPDSELELVRQWIAGGLLENASSTALKAKRPSAMLAQVDISAGRPEGPAAMPEDFPLEPVHVPARADAIVALAAHPWAPVTAVGAENQVLLHHSGTRDLLGIVPFPEGVICDLRFSRNGQVLLAAGGTAGRDGCVVMFDVRSGERLAHLATGYDAVLSADLRADHRDVVIGSTDKYIRIFDVASGAERHKIKKHTEWVTAVAYSPDGILLATGDRNGNLYIWEADTAQEFYALKGHTEQITELAWRRDSNILASSSEDGTIRLWTMNNGVEAQKWSSHGDGVLAIDFLPDGRLLTSGRDKMVRLWDGNGKEQKAFTLEAMPIQVRGGWDNETLVIGDHAGVLQTAGVTGTILGPLDMLPPRLEARLAGARAAQERAVAEVKAAEAGVVETEKSHALLLAQRDRHQAEHNASQAALGLAVKSLADVEGMLASNDGPMNEANRNAEAARLKAEQCEQALGTALESRKALLKDIEDLIAKMASMPADLPEVNLATKNQEVEFVTAEVTNRTQAHDEAIQALQTAERALASVNEERAALRQRADEQRQAVEQLTPEVTASQAALEAAAAELKKLSETMVSLQRTKDDAQVRVQAAKAEIVRWETAAFNVKVHAARTALKDKEAALQSHVQAEEDARKAREKAAEDVSAGKAELDALQKTYQTMKGAPAG